MSESVRFSSLAIADIEVPREARQRRLVDTRGLVESIRLRGVMTAIIVEENPEGSWRPYKLVTGERRLTASIEVGLATIPARLLSDLDPIEAQIIEWEENIKRSDLSWQDIVRGSAKIHGLYQLRDPEWTASQTADSVGLARGTISLYLTVNAALADERVASSGTVREAFNLLQRRAIREAGDAMEELGEMLRAPLAPAAAQGASSEIAEINRPAPPRPAARIFPDPTRSILYESFLQWAPRYEGKKFNLIHCDFPYGVGLFSSSGVRSGEQRSQMGRDEGENYDDDPDVYFGLLNCLLENLDRLMSLSGHLMFWYSEKHGPRTREAFAKRAPSLVFQPFPLVWIKSDNAGIAADVRQGPRHVYETAMMATRGRRPIVSVVADAYSAPTDKRWHVSTKPEPMLRHFFRMLVDENTRLLDPTCGSASALRAAESLGADLVLGLESDETTCGNARMAMRQARVLRASAGGQ